MKLELHAHAYDYYCVSWHVHMVVYTEVTSCKQLWMVRITFVGCQATLAAKCAEADPEHGRHEPRRHLPRLG